MMVGVNSNHQIRLRTKANRMKKTRIRKRVLEELSILNRRDNKICRFYRDRSLTDRGRMFKVARIGSFN